jgi:hypothetical protein
VYALAELREGTGAVDLSVIESGLAIDPLIDTMCIDSLIIEDYCSGAIYREIALAQQDSCLASRS